MTLQWNVLVAEKPAIGAAGWQACRLTARFREKHPGWLPCPTARTSAGTVETCGRQYDDGCARDRSTDTQPGGWVTINFLNRLTTDLYLDRSLILSTVAPVDPSPTAGDSSRATGYSGQGSNGGLDWAETQKRRVLTPFLFCPFFSF